MIKRPYCCATCRPVPTLRPELESLRGYVLSSLVVNAVLLLVFLCFLLSSCAYDDPGSLSLVGSPSISASFIDQVLAKYDSPAKGLGQVFYDEGLKNNVDPAFALGFFRHESGFGRSGEAVASLSIGNIRCLPNYKCQDNFAWFSSWAEGIRAWYTLLSGSLYIGSGLTTLSQVVHRYCPGSESAYVQSVAGDVQSWRSGQVS